MLLRPDSTAVRRSVVGAVWSVKLLAPTEGRFFYKRGWRPTLAWAERAARVRTERAWRRYERRTGWQAVNDRPRPDRRPDML